MAAALTNLPPEILHNILSYVEPEDLTWLPLTCRVFNNFIKGNNPLCRAIYLRVLDEPPVKDLDFEQELHDILKLKQLCVPETSRSTTTPSTQAPLQTHLPFVHRTVTRLLNHAITVPTPNPTTTSKSPNSHNQPPSPTRKSRARTFPASENTRFLESLFESEPARRAFLARSALYQRERALGVCGFTGEEDGEDGESEGVGGNEGDGVFAEGGVEGSGGGNGSSSGGGRASGRSRGAVTQESREVFQMSAKLHCLYGWGLGFEDGVRHGQTEGAAWRGRLTFARHRGGVYPLACSKVYDLREYTRGTKWGPFLDLGEEEDAEVRVDWEKVEAILVVLGGNIRCKGLERFPIFWHFWGKPFAGSWNGSYIPWSRDREKGEELEVKELDRLDPYGVAGSWLRVVSFLDFSDFFHFNFPIIDSLPRDLPRPPLDVGQATRLILMRIRVSKVEPAGPGDHPDHPVTHFTGFSRALDGSWDDNADASIRGTVRVTPEGEVRWTSYSVFHGEERWKSEGVQIGGIKSARGVVGTWFDKDFNAQGPCGPTAFWKISDREDTGDGPQVLLEDLFPLTDDMEEELMDEDDDARDEFNLQVLDPFGPDWTTYELEDDLDGLYYFDDEDIFDVEDVAAEMHGLGEERDDEDLDEDEDDYDDDFVDTLTYG
ncbi:hypothetical protein CHGG_04867 [Chaetomium globosum CBS 148.51]|uniref:F-box domain-containing protein n=1 Tax=Chaetomium globosum (strain ATCC 6205 / CBS 148.51 / DSM 1962 / NBRC 6347 / NRRL 1970) TaxID=306901 RepID=Q2H029_CHAGB|nr:uncharacterized protein CHGG_04867 [Chaetomium globosum CBS 148.51]EAQ88248.1 hypothetical protein CHGG_04867 [Chaetomium globosum CBS 148.51]